MQALGNDKCIVLSNKSKPYLLFICIGFFIHLFSFYLALSTQVWVNLNFLINNFFKLEHMQALENDKNALFYPIK